MLDNDDLERIVDRVVERLRAEFPMLSVPPVMIADSAVFPSVQRSATPTEVPPSRSNR